MQRNNMQPLNDGAFESAFLTANDAGTAYMLASPLWVQIWIGIMMLVLLPSFVLMV